MCNADKYNIQCVWYTHTRYTHKYENMFQHGMPWASARCWALNDHFLTQNAATPCGKYILLYPFVHLAARLKNKWRNPPSRRKAQNTQRNSTFFSKNFTNIWTGTVYHAVQIVTSYIYLLVVGSLLCSYFVLKNYDLYSLQMGGDK